MNKVKSVFMALIMTMIFTTTPLFADSETYTVQPDDSLWIISNKYKVDLEDVIVANPQIPDPDLIYPGDHVTVPAAESGAKAFEAQVLTLCNKERARHGIKPLVMNEALSRVAQAKSEDMRNANYFSHQSPTYGSPFDMLKKFGIPYRTAGENIAKGQRTPDTVVDAWLRSEGHRKNILNPNFKEMGVGYAVGNGSAYWTQIFVG